MIDLAPLDKISLIQHPQALKGAASSSNGQQKDVTPAPQVDRRVDDISRWGGDLDGCVRDGDLAPNFAASQEKPQEQTSSASSESTNRISDILRWGSAGL